MNENLFMGIKPKKDQSISNPSMHNLQVRWAMHHLDLANRTINKFWEYNNGNSSRLAESLLEAMAKLVKENAAYRDAAALLFIKEDLPNYREEFPDNVKEEFIDTK